MSILALHTASTGLESLSTEIDVIANNLANVNTLGFKRSRVNFEDLLYQKAEIAGKENAHGDVKPAGTYIGLGSRVSNTQLIFTQGSAIKTDSPTDMTIRGEGFFRVEFLKDVGGGIAYTRAGNFVMNRDGELVLANSDGYRLDPEVIIPEGAKDITIGSDGTIKVLLPGEMVPQEVGQINLFRFPNSAGLAQTGMNLYLATEASGDAIDAAPGEEGMGTILGGFLESSNVEAVKELIGLVKAQRAFELNSQVITTGNEMLQTITRLR